MDPFSLTAGALQIAAACVSCTSTVIKIYGDINSVDARIRSFCDEVAALRATYEGLEKSLSSPPLAEAVRVANQTDDGAHLWRQIKDALDDSKNTMKRVNDILTQIAKTSGFARKVKAHLQENLHNGELSRLRQRIQFFNSALSLPIQMVCVMLQLEQRGITTEHQTSLDAKLIALERTMRALVQSLNSPSRSQTLSGSTIAATEKLRLDQDDGMKTYIAFAKQFLSTASAAASTRSSLSTISPAIEPDALRDMAKTSANEVPLPADRRNRVEGWIQPPSRSTLQSGGFTRQPSRSARGHTEAYSDVEFLRTQNHLKLGQESFEDGDYAKAERHFRKALALMERHDFEGRISFQPAEVVLMLADCCRQQEKLDEAVKLLEPVAAMRTDIFPSSSKDQNSPEETQPVSHQVPDKLQALAASHMLGRVYILKSDFDAAEEHGLRAFTERRKELGPQDEKTLESVQLVIDVYRTRGDDGDEEEAEGYEVFLSPPEKATPTVSTEKLLNKVGEPQPSPDLVSPESPLAPEAQNSHRPKLVNRLLHRGRPSQSGSASNLPSPELLRLSISRSVTLNDALDPDPSGPFGIRGLSSPSETSTHDRSLSINDDSSITTPGSAQLERSSSSKTLEPTYQAIADLCHERRLDKAAKVALQYLNTYQSNYMVIRKPELRDNIRHGTGYGLARTGRGYAPLHFFCELKEEHAEEVNLLIKHGADVNAIAFQAGYTQSNPKDPFTALQQATERGFSTITGLLLAVSGIKTDVRDPEGYTPLMVACRKGHHSIVKQLLEFPLPTEFPATWHGNTLLHDAARRCDPVLVEMLLEHTANIDERDRFSKTALMHAVVKADIADPSEKRRRIRGRCKTVQVLLEAGADPTLRDHRTNKTVRDYAMEEDDAELLMLLGQVPRTGISELVA
ncbi:uncharacterized protein Z519_08380 [Cladophialophora bantiana CBS 173.52]|uniref:Fungal N-terminal domain-containing protein n=1 Tax=Cladophialophora bantiana (strain ATCC 10958 / CBS 173.52 / CDC B-1940 / NIH 8579) TaxID=1442370 RepID=A0A0D2FVM3_CLAB1|nr:uncharacterized protein Z519_08380 [Cladophialophora bantiana CBS 173.52]KIW90597.1 hypothetical protein Z519_08380 [Cladophialophora bantiana CBS 173.52]